MTNLALFEYEGQQVRATGDGRFSVYDVLVAFGVCDKSNCQKVLKRISGKHSEVLGPVALFKFPGRGQRFTPVAPREVCEMILGLVGKHPTQDWVFNDKFFPKTENQIVLVLTEAFQDCEPCTQFYCEGYRIDLYLAKPRIAIECDEYGHHDYCDKAEMKRESAVKKALGCSFVRFDPYATDFNLGDVIFSIRGLV